MTIETLLAIASFAISVGGFISSVFIFKDHWKRVALIVTIILLVATTGAALYQHYQHNRQISKVEKEIIEKLSYNRWTFDQLYHELHFKSFPLVSEALFRGIEKGIIGDNVIEVRINYDFQQVRVYYVKSSQ